MLIYYCSYNIPRTIRLLQKGRKPQSSDDSFLESLSFYTENGYKIKKGRYIQSKHFLLLICIGVSCGAFMKYAIGLDCGITSVGYSVMELDANDEPKRIIKLGSRIFERAEHPKDGSSLALPRREARGLRRRIRRHQHRLERIRFMLTDEGVLTDDELENLFTGQLSDIYELRTKALDEPISNTEFARILINLAQRRGFKSNRKIDSKEKEAGALLSAVSENQALMDLKGYRTVGEMFFKDEKYAEYKRNKGESYCNTVSRSMVENEIKLVFEAQRKYKKSFADELIEKKYTDMVLSQRPFDLGPGEGNKNSPSHYSGNQVEKMIGKCTLIPDEKRAAKATYSFQMFNLLQNINHISLYSVSGEKYVLSEDERKKVKDICLITKTVTYSTIRKKLSIPEKYLFKNITYSDSEISVIEKKTKFEYLKAYHTLKSVLGDDIYTLSADEIDAIGYIFTVHKNDEKITEALNTAGISPNLFEKLLELPSFAKFGHISVTACKALIPYLEKGMIYSEACEAAGFEFRGHAKSQKEMYLSANAEELKDIVNPVVKRAVSQTVKVINAIIREQGCSPTYLNIELARELSKSYKERSEIEKQYAKNRQANEKIIKELCENFEQFKLKTPSGQDIIKLKLYHEQSGICPYSLAKLKYEKLFDVGYVDVDHIVPYSKSYDDSFNNKVLVLSSENRQKGNRLPLEYLSDNKKDDYRVWVNANVRNYKKKKNLLKFSLSKEDLEGFKERNLNDTKYLSRFLLNFIGDNLLFEPFSDSKRVKHVTSVNGAATSYMRKRWGISKIREDGDLHHAVDATVIACVTNALVKKISDYSKNKEIQYCDYKYEESVAVDSITGEFIDKFPLPYPTFRKELEIRSEIESPEALAECLYTLPNYTKEIIEKVKPCFVSRMTNHKVTGAAHEDTIRSEKVINGRKGTVTKTPLAKLKLKDGEIEGYYNPESDTLLYNALKERLALFGGNGEKAFPQGYEFHKPKSNGEEGPVVKKVKIFKTSSLNVPARQGGGVADNGSMVRIDVFFVEGKGYYFIPIYVSDTVKPELPNKACVAHKPYEEWAEMKEEDFVFSLYSNDLIRFETSKENNFKVNFQDSSLPREKYLKSAFAYYKGADISNASISLITHDNAYNKDGFGIKRLLKIEKFSVDPLGNITKVNKERRMRFN